MEQDSGTQAQALTTALEKAAAEHAAQTAGMSQRMAAMERMMEEQKVQMSQQAAVAAAAAAAATASWEARLAEQAARVETAAKEAAAGRLQVLAQMEWETKLEDLAPPQIRPLRVPEGQDLVQQGQLFQLLLNWQADNDGATRITFSRTWWSIP